MNAGMLGGLAGNGTSMGGVNGNGMPAACHSFPTFITINCSPPPPALKMHGDCALSFRKMTFFGLLLIHFNEDFQPFILLHRSPPPTHLLPVHPFCVCFFFLDLSGASSNLHGGGGGGMMFSPNNQLQNFVPIGFNGQSGNSASPKGTDAHHFIKSINQI